MDGTAVSEQASVSNDRSVNRSDSHNQQYVFPHDQVSPGRISGQRVMSRPLEGGVG